MNSSTHDAPPDGVPADQVCGRRSSRRERPAHHPDPYRAADAVHRRDRDGDPPRGVRGAARGRGDRAGRDAPPPSRGMIDHARAGGRGRAGHRRRPVVGTGGRGLRRRRGRQRRRRAVEGHRERLRRHRPGRDAARPGRLPGGQAAARGGPVDADPDAHRDGRRPGPRRGPGQRGGRLPAQAVLLPGPARAPALADPPHARRPAGGAVRGWPGAGSGRPHRHPGRRPAGPDQPRGRGARVPAAAQGTRGVQDRAARALLGRQLRR